MDAITPRFKHAGGLFYFGLNKRENKMYACIIKSPPQEKAKLKEEDLNKIVNISPIHSIKKMVNGGVVVCWTNGRMTIYEPLDNGEVLLNNIDHRSILTRYDRGRELFSLQGHAEFDLLECLFKGA